MSYRFTRSIGFVSNSSSTIFTVKIKPSVLFEFRDRFNQFLEEYKHKIIHLARHDSLTSNLDNDEIIHIAKSLPKAFINGHGEYSFIADEYDLAFTPENAEDVIYGIALDLFKTSKYCDKKMRRSIKIDEDLFLIPSLFHVRIITPKVMEGKPLKYIIKSGSNLIEKVKEAPQIFYTDDPSFILDKSQITIYHFKESLEVLPKIIGFDGLFINDDQCLLCIKDMNRRIIQIDDKHHLVIQHAQVIGENLYMVALISSECLIYFM
jgi:hypothetical protein